MQQQLTQRQERSDQAVETREERSLDARVERVMGGLRVELEETILRAGKSVDTITLDEEVETSSFAVPRVDVLYKQLVAEQTAAWDAIQAALTVDAVPGDWIPAVPAATAPTRETGSAPAPPDKGDTPLRLGTVVSRPAVSRPAYEPAAVESYRVPARSEADAPAVPVPEPMSQPVPDTLATGVRVAETYRPALLAPMETAPSLTVEPGTVTYTVDAAQAGGTVADALLALVEREGLDATIVEQPFYLAEDEKGGWQEYAGVVQLANLDMDMTEYTVNGDLARDGIADVELAAGDTLAFEEDEAYTCGAVEADRAYREAWQDRYGLDETAFAAMGATERGVYAAMVDGNDFRGAPLDLARYEGARDAYIDATGDVPERVLDNVMYQNST